MKCKDYVLTVSYGDYTVGVGGTDKVIISQQTLFNNRKISVLHIAPINKIGRICVDSFLWQILEDGENVGVFSTESVTNYIASLSKSQHALNAFIIHHLKDIEIAELRRIIDLSEAPVFFYLHDYMTICPSGGMLRNGEEFCGIYDSSNEKCRGCCYYNEKMMDTSKNIETFFRKYESRLSFIAPSEAAKRIWTRKYAQYSKKVLIIYHQDLLGEYIKNRNEISEERTLRIAFVGYQRPLKGWNQWYQAVKIAKKKNCNYKFYQFGTVEDHLDYIEEVSVDFKKNDFAMTEALRKKQIDIAVLWSTCPETYSYTYYEAFAANCFILTNEQSGNIADQVKERHNGLIGKTIDSLSLILSNESELRNSINEFRRKKICGPEFLRENGTITNLVKKEEFFPQQSVKRVFIKEIKAIRCNILIRLYRIKHIMRLK